MYQQDVIYNFKRCIGINGINLGATKSDLIDRGLIIEHIPIPKHRKRLLKEIWQKFFEIRPQLLGYIFDILVKVLKFQKQNPDGLKLSEYSRLADFAEIGEIISRCMGYKPGKFIDAYFRNIDLQTTDNPRDMSLELNRISSCISPEENVVNVLKMKS
jgi:hypothetical protein